jgi:hypothetical protein
MNKLFFTFCLYSLSMFAMAQSPNSLSYQAIIRNSNNELVANKIVAIKISIIRDSAGGTAAYSERHTPTTNGNGLISIEIGNGTPMGGSIQTIPWSDRKYYLKTEVDPTGGSSYTISGVTQFLSVPYAFHANTASKLRGTTEIELTEPILGGKMYLTAPGNGSTGGLGTSGNHGLYFFTKNVDRMIIDTNGRIGLGTFSPVSTIHLATPSPEIQLQNTQDNVSLYLTAPGSMSTGGLGTPNNYGLYFFTNNQDRAVISAIGNLGIGAFGPGKQPPSRISLETGDVNIMEATKGVIMKSPNGGCWRLTIDNSGNIVTTSISCP